MFYDVESACLEPYALGSHQLIHTAYTDETSCISSRVSPPLHSVNGAGK